MESIPVDQNPRNQKRAPRGEPAPRRTDFRMDGYGYLAVVSAAP